MEKIFPAGTREAILGFHLTDRMKAELHVASNLLQSVKQMTGAAGSGGSSTVHGFPQIPGSGDYPLSIRHQRFRNDPPEDGFYRTARSGRRWPAG